MALGILVDPAVGAPTWVESGAEEVDGLDLLALREPVMRIGNSLLDGITTITPTIRYMSFVVWITWLYWKREGADHRGSFLDFARRVEAAIGLGNIAFKRDTLGLIGADGVRATLEDPLGVPLTLKVRALASAIYAGPAEQLGLLVTRPDVEIPHLTESRGIPLAETVDSVLRSTRLGQRISNGDIPERVAIDELRAFGEVAHLEAILPAEGELLLSALLPERPVSTGERNRLASYAAFLARAAQDAQDVNALITVAGQSHRGLDVPIQDVLDGWALYAVRDMLAFTHEYALAAVLDRLPRTSVGGPAWRTPGETVRNVLSERTFLDEVLRDLGLLSRTEHWHDLAFRELEDRVVRATSADMLVERGLRRWGAGLTEAKVIAVVRGTGAGAPVALPVAWLLAARRAEPGIREHQPAFAALSREGHYRLGMEQVVLPAIERFRRADSPLVDVVDELLAWTVEQHLRTAWSRLAVDPRKDVALFCW